MEAPEDEHLKIVVATVATLSAALHYFGAKLFRLYKEKHRPVPTATPYQNAKAIADLRRDINEALKDLRREMRSEINRERGQRHALQKTLVELTERIAFFLGRLEGGIARDSDSSALAEYSRGVAGKMRERFGSGFEVADAGDDDREFDEYESPTSRDRPSERARRVNRR